MKLLACNFQKNTVSRSFQVIWGKKSRKKLKSEIANLIKILPIIRQNEALVVRFLEGVVSRSEIVARCQKDLDQPSSSSEARGLSDLGQTITSSEARGLRNLSKPTTSSEARGLRSLGQPIISSGARGSRNLCQPITSSEARGLRNLIKSTTTR